MPKNNSKDSFSKEKKNERSIAALGYISILCVIPLLFHSDNEYIKFHGKQGLILFLIEIIGNFVFWIPVIGWILFVLVVLAAVFGFLNALRGEMWRIPYVADWADKIKL